MKYKILIFKDGIAIEPIPGVRRRWLVKRNVKGILWELKDDGAYWFVYSFPFRGGELTSYILFKTDYEVEEINDYVDNWKYYK